MSVSKTPDLVLELPRTSFMPAKRADFPLSQLHGFRDSYARVQRCRRCGIIVAFGDRCDYCRCQSRPLPDGPGQYFGRHHSEWIPTVDELIIQGDDDEAEFLLWKLIEAGEAESQQMGAPPFERHYRRLGQLAARRNDPGLAKQVRDRYDAATNLGAATP
jgi:hypothetical protein